MPPIEWKFLRRRIIAAVTTVELELLGVPLELQLQQTQFPPLPLLPPPPPSAACIISSDEAPLSLPGGLQLSTASYKLKEIQF